MVKWPRIRDFLVPGSTLEVNDMEARDFAISVGDCPLFLFLFPVLIDGCRPASRLSFVPMEARVRENLAVAINAETM